MSKRHTTAERAYIANLIRMVDPLTSGKAILLWRSEAEILLDVLDNDEHTSDVPSTVALYGYVSGIQQVLHILGAKPFDTDEDYNKAVDFWKQIMDEYLAEMRRGVGREDVDY